MIDLYYWPTPNGWKISVALEELGLPYRLHLVDITKGDQFAPAFLEIAPNNRMPAIVDSDGPDGQPVSIFESGAILLYLAEKTGRLDGEDARARIAVREWLMWQMGGLGPMAGQCIHFNTYAPRLDPPQDLPYARARYETEVSRLYDVLERRLEQTAFVAGPNYTIADIAIWSWAHLWRRQGQTLENRPNMARWLDRIKARPAVQIGRALAVQQGRAAMERAPGAQDLLFRR